MINISDGFLNLLDDGGKVREDLPLPEGDLGRNIEGRFEGGQDVLLTVLQALGKEAILAVKSMSNYH